MTLLARVEGPTAGSVCSDVFLSFPGARALVSRKIGVTSALDGVAWPSWVAVIADLTGNILWAPGEWVTHPDKGLTPTGLTTRDS